MKDESVPLSRQDTTEGEHHPSTKHTERRNKEINSKDHQPKKKKHNLWPLKAMILALVVSSVVNLASELVLVGAKLWLAIIVTLVILLLGVIFDMVGTAATSCDVQPFLSMASRKIKGGKTSVKLAKQADVVSSICCDVVGDICGIVSGGCAATIITVLSGSGNMLISMVVYAAISTITITLKAIGKSYAVKKANKIIFIVAKILTIFKKEG